MEVSALESLTLPHVLAAYDTYLAPTARSARRKLSVQIQAAKVDGTAPSAPVAGTPTAASSGSLQQQQGEAASSAASGGVTGAAAVPGLVTGRVQVVGVLEAYKQARPLHPPSLVPALDTITWVKQPVKPT